MNKNLDKIFQPKTVAVIGASNRPGTVGFAIMYNLIGKGFEGTVFPVNFKENSVQGVKCYKDVSQIPDPDSRQPQ